MVSTHLVISKSFNPCTNPLVTVPRAPITIGITVTFIFHSFFHFPLQGLATYPSFCPLSILLCGLLGQQSPQFSKFSFFLLIITRSGHLAKIRWSICISKSQRILCTSFSRTDSELGIYHLFVWSKFNILHSSQWITFPTQSCLVLYSFCANLLHSLIMRLIISCIIT